MREVQILPEMIAAGLEAWDEAQGKGLDRGVTVIEIYLAMRGWEVKAYVESPETVQ